MGISAWFFLRPRPGERRPLAQSAAEAFIFHEIMATIPEAALGDMERSKRPPGVVGAEHKFAKRRLENLSHWKPTRDELAKLRELVNHKAGREIM